MGWVGRTMRLELQPACEAILEPFRAVKTTANWSNFSSTKTGRWLRGVVTHPAHSEDEPPGSRSSQIHLISETSFAGVFTLVDNTRRRLREGRGRGGGGGGGGATRTRQRSLWSILLAAATGKTQLHFISAKRLQALQFSASKRRATFPPHLTLDSS